MEERFYETRSVLPFVHEYIEVILKVKVALDIAHMHSLVRQWYYHSVVNLNYVKVNQIKEKNQWLSCVQQKFMLCLTSNILFSLVCNIFILTLYLMAILLLIDVFGNLNK